MKLKISDIVVLAFGVLMIAGLIAANFFGVTVETHPGIEIPCKVVYYGFAGAYFWYCCS